MYEIVDKKLQLLPPRTLEEVGMQPFFYLKKFYKQSLEDTDATNELINDGEFVQPLTAEEIQTLQKSGVHASVSLAIFHLSSLF